MVDRLEELLALMEDEDEEKEEDWQEDIPALRSRTGPAAAPEEDGGEAVPAGRGEKRDAPAEWAGDAVERLAGETAEANVSALEEMPEEGLMRRLEAAAQPGQRPDILMRAPGEEPVQPEWPEAAGVEAARSLAEAGETPARTARHEADSGLERLYHQAVQAARPAPQALNAEQAGRSVRAEEPGRTAVFTVDELDRAVRRDSRRYDGGMTIF